MMKPRFKIYKIFSEKRQYCLFPAFLRKHFSFFVPSRLEIICTLKKWQNTDCECHRLKKLTAAMLGILRVMAAFKQIDRVYTEINESYI